MRAEETKQNILVLLSEHDYGLSIEEIASMLRINRMTASKYLSILDATGGIIVRSVGKAKLHYPRNGNVRKLKLLRASQRKSSCGLNGMSSLSMIFVLLAAALFALSGAAGTSAGPGIVGDGFSVSVVKDYAAKAITLRIEGPPLANFSLALTNPEGMSIVPKTNVSFRTSEEGAYELRIIGFVPGEYSLEIAWSEGKHVEKFMVEPYDEFVCDRTFVEYAPPEGSEAGAEGKFMWDVCRDFVEADVTREQLVSRLARDREFVEALSGRKSFRHDEKPEFIFYRTTADSPESSAEQDGQYGMQAGDEKPGVIILDPDHSPADIEADVASAEGGGFVITASSRRAFRPGLYRIMASLHGESREAEFLWGLISLNTKRSIYRPGETAEMEIVVLDTHGHPVCGAGISLSVTGPDGSRTEYSTLEGGVSAGSECGLYYANYTARAEGNHAIEIAALIDGVEVSFSSGFAVMSAYAFDIVRFSESRIDPTLGNRFYVRIDVESFAGAGPVVIREFVPPELEIAETDAEVTKIEGAKVLEFARTLEENRTSVSYSYSVPLVWPYLYETGPVEIAYDGRTFTEARPWYVAVDPESGTARIDPSPTASASDTLKGYCNATEPNKTVSYVVSWFTDGALNKTVFSDALERVGAIPLNSGEDTLRSAVIDQPNGFAYFGTETNPGIVVKVNLSDFTRAGNLTLNPGENSLYSAVIDQPNGFAYFGTYTTPGVVVKINLSDFTRAGNLTLDSGENSLVSAVIDQPNGFAYFGTYTAPGIVVKVNLSDFTRAGSIVLEDGEDYVSSAVIDQPNGFAYFGTYTTPGVVVKINLSDFTRAGSIYMESNDDYLSSAVIDQPNGYAYFGTATDPGRIVRINLSDFQRVDSNVLDEGEISLSSAVIDQPNGFAYFGANTPTGVVTKTNLSSFQSAGEVALNTGEDLLYSAVIDQPNGYAYFGTGTSPANITKISLRQCFNSSQEVNVDNISSGLVLGQSWKLQCQISGEAGTPYYVNSSVTSISDPAPNASIGTNPEDSSTDSDGSVAFDLKCSDDSGVNALQLWGNWSGSWSANQINSTPVNDTWWNVTVDGIPGGTWKWAAWCNDSAGQGDWSDENRTLTVGPESPANYTDFGCGTTDFNSQGDLGNVSGAVLENCSSGKIAWHGSINATGADFDAFVNISFNLISIDSAALNETMNSSATLSLFNLPFGKAPIINRNSAICPPSICAVDSYSGGNLTFNITQFSNYSSGANANLSVWDDTDSLARYAGQNVTFYANYTNITSGESVNGTGIGCNVSFNVSDAGPFEMAFNPASLLYEYNRTFASAGTFEWNASCNGSVLEYEPLNVSDTADISEAPAMNSSRISPGVAYRGSTLYGYCNATDADGDDMSYSVQWFRNGALNQSAQSALHNFSRSLIESGNWAWLESREVTALGYDATRSLLYVGAEGGKFGVYNTTSNASTDLSTEFRVWAGPNNDIVALVVDEERNIAYMSRSDGSDGSAFGAYSPSTGIVVDFTGTVSDWTDYINALYYDSVHNRVYITGINSSFMVTFGFYDPATNTSADLTAAANGGEIEAVRVDSERNLVYFGGSNSFGVYNATSNASTDLSGALANWTASGPVESLAFDSERNLVYIGGDSMEEIFFGVYNATSNTSADLTGTLSGLGETLYMETMDYDAANNVVYLVLADDVQQLILAEHDPATNSTEDVTEEWMQSLYVGVTEPCGNGMLYLGGIGGLGAYNGSAGSGLRLSGSGLFNIFSMPYAIAYDGVRDLVHIGSIDPMMNHPGVFAVYNASSDAVANRSDVISGWAALPNIMSIASDDANGLVYIGGLDVADYGVMFGLYNATSGTGTDLTGAIVDASGDSPVSAIGLDTERNLLYFATSDMFGTNKFGIYNATGNESYNLDETDAGGWFGTNAVRTLAADSPRDLVYIGGSSSFGVYNRSSNVSYSLNGTDDGWLDTVTVYALAADSSRDLVYIGGEDSWDGEPAFGAYNRSSNESIDLSGAVSWIGGNILVLALDSSRNLVYIGGEDGKFGVYNATSNESINLSNAVSSWLYGDIYALALDGTKSRVYIGGGDLGGFAGYYSLTSYQQGVEQMLGSVSGLSIGEQWTFSCLASDGAANSSWLNSSAVDVVNSVPTVPVLSSPADGADDVGAAGLVIDWHESGDWDWDSVSYDLNVSGSCNSTYEQGISGSQFEPDELCASVTYTWTVRACDSYNCSAWAASRTFTTLADNPPTALIGTNPPDMHTDSDGSITFDLKCSDDTSVNMLHLWGNWSGSWAANQTNSTPVNDTWWNITVDGIPGGTWKWAAWCNDSAGQGDWSDTNRTLTVTTTAIDSCRDLDSNGMTYELGQPVTSSATCFNVTANNVTLDCKGNTISHCTGALGYGVNSSLGYDNITMRNCTFNQTSNSFGYCHGAYFANSDNVMFINNTVQIYRGDGVYLYMSDGANITNNTFLPKSGGQWGMIVLDASDNVTIERNNITSIGAKNWAYGPAKAIGISRSKTAILRNNTVTSDYWGAVYVASYGVGTENFNHTIGEDNTVNGKPVKYIALVRDTVYQNLNWTGYDVMVANVTNVSFVNITLDHISIADDVFNSSLVNSTITSNSLSALELYSNNNVNSFDVRNTVINHTANTYPVAVKSAYNLTFVNNTILNSGNITTVYQISGPVTISLVNNTVNSTNSESVSLGLNANDIASNVTLEGNAISAAGASDHYGVRLFYAANRAILKDNRITASGEALLDRLYNSGARTVIVNDTFLNSTSNFDFDIEGNVSGDINLTNVTFANSNINVSNSGAFNLNVFWYASANVTDSSGNSLEGAEVNVTDKDGTLVYSGLTGADGLTQSKPLQEYWRNASSSYYYSNYTANASKAGYSNGSQAFNLTTNKVIGIALTDFPPEASVGANPPDQSVDYDGSVTFDLKCADSVGADTLQLWGNWSGEWAANQTNSTPASGEWWNVTVDGIPGGAWRWAAWCNDSAGQGDWSDTNRTLTVDNTPPSVYFISPTDNDSAVVSRNWSYVNVSVADAYNTTAFIDWNRSLVGWWRFNNESGENETLFRDWSTWGDNGTCIGANCPNYTNGKFGKALNFDGVEDYGSIPAVDLSGTNAITISFWLNWAAYANDDDLAMEFSSNYNNDVGGFIIDPNSGSGGGTCNFEVSLKGDVNYNNACFPRPSAGSWYHYMIVFNKGNPASTEVTPYVDGVAVSYDKTYVGENTNNFGNLPLYLMSRAGSQLFGAGSIDDVRVFSRALSEEEINASYNAGLYRLYHNFTNLADGNHTFRAYAQDAAGNVNGTEERTIVVDTAASFISFVPPTPDNGTSTSNTSVLVNVSISEADLGRLTYGWNGTNLTLYDNSLLLMLGFNNLSALGENATLAADASEYGNDATIAGAFWTPNGRHGGAYQFDGADDHADAGNDSVLNAVGGLTIAAWIKTSANESVSFSNGGFESGDLSGWSTGGDADWSANDTARTGSYSAASGIIDNDQSTYIMQNISLARGVYLSFWWKVGSEACCDFLLFCLDNPGCTAASGYTDRIGGEANWTKATFYLPPGNHSLEWKYEKDAAASEGADRGWVDDVELRYYDMGIVGKSDYGSPHRQYELDYYGERVRAAISPDGLSYGDDGNYTLASNASVADGNWHSVAFVFDNSTSAMRLYIDGALDSQKTANIPSLYAGGVPLAIGAKLSTDINGGFESGTIDGWDAAGKAWTAAAGKGYGAYAASSGAIPDEANTSMMRDVTMLVPGNLSFVWNVSSEANFDYLLFCLDNDACTPADGYTRRISGETQESNTTYLSAGTHSLKWMYAKDMSGVGGTDSGWIDNVTITGAHKTVSKFFNGSIDEARIWNRSLSAEEILQMHFSNVYKYNATQWYLTINQSKNATAGLTEGNYDFQAWAQDAAGNVNSTEEREIQVQTCSVDFNMTYQLQAGISFAQQDPGIGNASAVSNGDYNVTDLSTSGCGTVNVSILAVGDLMNESSTIGIGNVTVNSTSPNSQAIQLSNSYQLIRSNVPAGSLNVTSLFFWLTIPAGQEPRTYNTSVYIREERE